MMQGGGGIVAPPVVPQGGSFVVRVGPTEGVVSVGVPGAGWTDHDVGEDQQVTVPVPNVPPGTIVIIRVGTGLHARRVAVLVAAPPP
jgi:hypothetical protein